MTVIPSNAHLFTTPASRYQALLTRNPAAHNAFIYSVTTTKIYCRPTCPARLARRSNILFHDSPSQAAAAGFRPCKRCHPDALNGGEDAQVVMVEKICALIQEEAVVGVEKWGVKNLAREVGVTESHLCRVFKKIIGVTIGEYRATSRTGNYSASSSISRSGSVAEVSEAGLQVNPVEAFIDGNEQMNPWAVKISSMDWRVLDEYTEPDCFEFITFDEPVSCTV